MQARAWWTNLSSLDAARIAAIALALGGGCSSSAAPDAKSDAGDAGGGGPPLMATNAGSIILGAAVAPGAPIDPGMPPGAEGCTSLVAVVRDFKGVGEPSGHPDFEPSFGGGPASVGLVDERLGPDDKPVYTAKCEGGNPAASCPHGQQTTSKTAFDQWYRTTEGVNHAFQLRLQFQAVAGASAVGSTRFFPLDGAGWGASGLDDDGKSRNFGFTTELHARFKYNGGEQFSIAGDDDLWVFVNGHLVVDLGGLHPALSRMVELDRAAATLGITPGNVYSLDLFHAERHTRGSNFYVNTTLSFVECGKIIP